MRCVPVFCNILLLLTIIICLAFLFRVDPTLGPHRERAAGSTADLIALGTVTLRTEHVFVTVLGHTRHTFAVGLARDRCAPTSPVAHPLCLTLFLAASAFLIRHFLRLLIPNPNFVS